VRPWRLTGTLATVHRNCAGDGANDLAMIDAAGLGIAFCAKPNVQATVGYWSTINVHRLDAALYFLGIRPKDLPPHSPHSKPTGLKR
jgi:phosphoserine phosphatase